MSPLPPPFVNLWELYGLKLLRLCGVSLFNLVFGSGLLYFFHAVVGMRAWIAQVLAVVVSAVPAYLLSRHWVWQKRGKNSFRSEIVPFWSMALLGLLAATATVAFADKQFDGSNIAVQLASIGAFGVVWVVKFVLLDRVIWKDRSETAAEPAPPADARQPQPHPAPARY